MINDLTLITQVDVLKFRYDKHTTFLDRLARFYGKQNEILKIALQYLFIGLTVLSVFCLSIYATFAMMIFTAFIFFLDEHDELMETRFFQLSQDLKVSEKQLQQAFAQNMDLESQLTSAVQKNQEVTHELGEIKKAVLQLREQILEKEQVIETTRGLLEHSFEQIQALVSETIEIKNGVSEKAVLFSEQIASTEIKIKGLFSVGAGISNKLKESSEFRENMDAYLQETLGNKS